MKKSLLILCAVASALTMTAQSNPFGGGTPPSAELGKCYAKCYIPSQYETVTEQVLTKAAATRLEAVPAQYETATEQVLVKEAYSKLEIIPASFETVTEQILIKEAGTRVEPVPAVFETVTEKVLVSEASTRWTMKKDKNCMSADPNDCFVACYEEVPERYTTYTSSVLKTPATTRTVDVPAEYKTMTKRVLKSPATTQSVDVPAVYKTVTKRVLKTPATTRETPTDAAYKTITKRQLVKAGEYSDWREVLCDNKVTNYTIRQIQQALIDAGYDVGAAGADNVMGADSRAALMQYQKANNLPVGNLNIETLQKLGIKY